MWNAHRFGSISKEIDKRDKSQKDVMKNVPTSYIKNLTWISAHTETYICITKHIGRESIGISYISKVDPGEEYGLQRFWKYHGYECAL